MTVSTQPQPKKARGPWLQRLREIPSLQGLALISPTLLYLLIFLVVPLILVVILSFMTRGPYGNVVYTFTVENYARLMDTLYLRVVGYSVYVAGATTIATILIGYPLAYFIARSPVKQRSMWLFLILVPFLDQLHHPHLRLDHDFAHGGAAQHLFAQHRADPRAAQYPLHPGGGADRHGL